MSEALRIALVAEGPTDRIVIESAIAELLGGRRFRLTQLQPEGSIAFGSTGAGWGGVYRWCQQVREQADGSLRNCSLFSFHDILIIHLDADVAGRNYADANIKDPNDGLLPCAKPCPPPSDTTDALRTALLHWLGEQSVPPRTVLCTPSKSTDAWMVAAVFDSNPIVKSGSLECDPHPETMLRVKRKGQRIRKSVREFRKRTGSLQRAWSGVRRACTEAERFSSDFLRVVSASP